MAKKETERKQFRSVIDRTIHHSGIVIQAGEVFEADVEFVKELIDKKFIMELKTKAV